MDKPAVYRIKVRGVVPESWIDRLGGVEIVSVTSAVTTLEGQVRDQAELKGVLDTLYELHLFLMEVTCLKQIRYASKEHSTGCEGKYRQKTK